MAYASAQQTLYNRIGGEPAVRKLVYEFYDRVLANPTLKPFFENTPMDRLRAMQFEMFAAALDGPAYSGHPLPYVHHGRGITPEHFGLFIDCLLETLKDLHLDKDATLQLIDRLNLYADDIMGGTNASE